MSSYLKSDPIKFWRYLSPRKVTPDGLIYNDTKITEHSQLASCFNDYFSTVFSVDDGRMPDFEYTVSDSILPYICLSQEGIFTAILNLNKKKAIGPDNIPNEFLLRYAECCSRFLYLLFNKSLTEGHIPREWKCAKIVPIHKSGVKSAASNYRPISLLCATGKILEHIVAKHI